MRSSPRVDRLLELLLGLGQRGAAQHRLDAAAELAHRERLGDVVVGAELEAEHLVDLLGLGGEHDDRHGAARADLRGRRRSRPACGSITSSTTRSKLSVAQPVERLAAVERRDDLVALLAQRIGEQLLNRLLVVDEQDAGCGGASPSEIVGWSADRMIEPRDLPGGVRPGAAGGGPGDVLAPEPAAAAAAGPGRGRALRRQPGGRAGGARIADRARPTGGPGTPRRPGDRRSSWRDAFAARGFAAASVDALQRFTHAGRELVNVVGRRAGELAAPDRDRRRARRARRAGRARQRRRHRRAAGARRVFQGRPSRKTLVLASVDGSTLGEVGAERLVDELARAGAGGRRARDLRPGLALEPRPDRCTWSNDATPRRHRAPAHGRGVDPRGARATAGGSGASASSPGCRSRSGSAPRACCSSSGYDAVRISGSGELPPTGHGPAEAIDPDRLGALGRATLRTVTALDQGAAPRARARELRDRR